jgi:hypothetical protein
MFKSYKGAPYPSQYSMLVVDDDFEAEAYSGWGGIIAVYEQRKLPVAPNLVRAMLYYCHNNRLNIGPTCYAVLNRSECLQYKEEAERLLLLL